MSINYLNLEIILYEKIFCSNNLLSGCLNPKIFTINLNKFLKNE